MQLYEMLYIIRNDYSDDQIPSIKKKIEEIIIKHAPGSSIENTEDLGRRRLAYPIKKEMSGFYTLIDFKASPEHSHTLNREIELSEDILRHLIVMKHVKTPEQIKREKMLREKAEQAQEVRQREEQRDSAGAAKKQSAMVQKKEDLQTTGEPKEETVEQLEEKLDEILKRDIVE